MLRMPNSGLWLAAILGIAGGSTCAQAAIIYDNFDPGGGFDTGPAIAPAASAQATVFAPIVDVYRSAVQFTVSGGNYTLDSMSLAIQKSDGSPDLLRIRLLTDSAGAPGSTLETLSENQAIWPTVAPISATTLLSTLHPLLSNGVSYWIVAELSGPTEDAFYSWKFNTTGTKTGHRTDVESTTFGSPPTDPWGSAFQQNIAFSVSGTLNAPPPPPPPSVPEPGTLTLAGLGACGLIARALRRRRHPAA